MKLNSPWSLLVLASISGCSRGPDTSLSHYSRNLLAGLKPSDVLEVEFLGEHVRRSPNPEKYDDPVIERDPTKLAELLKAFQSAKSTASVTSHGGEVPDEIEFRFTKATGRDEVHLTINGVTVTEEYGPQVEIVYDKYFHKPVVKDHPRREPPQ